MNTGDTYALLAAVIWSVSVIYMRIAGFKISPLPLNIFKNTIAIVGFFIIAFFWEQVYWPEISASAYLRLCISAVIGISVADVFISSALNRLGAGLQAIADCVYAPVVTFVGYLLFAETLSPLEFLGGGFVVAAVFLGVRSATEVESKKDLYVGLALALTAHSLMAIGILMVRDIYRELSIFWVSGFRFSFATIVLVAWGYWRLPAGELFKAFHLRSTWRHTIPMSVLGAFMATLFWVAGFKHTTAGRAAIYNQMSTVFIIILATFVLKEKMTPRKALGVALGFAGALIVALN